MTIPASRSPRVPLTTPSFKLGVLTDKGCLTTFLEVFDWVFDEIKKAEAAPTTPVTPSSESSDQGEPHDP